MCNGDKGSSSCVTGQGQVRVCNGVKTSSSFVTASKGQVRVL